MTSGSERPCPTSIAWLTVVGLGGLIGDDPDGPFEDVAFTASNEGWLVIQRLLIPGGELRRRSRQVGLLPEIAPYGFPSRRFGSRRGRSETLNVWVASSAASQSANEPAESPSGRARPKA